MMRGVSLTVMRYELGRISRQSHVVIKAPFLFLMFVTLTRLALPPEIPLSGPLATGIILIGALLSCLLSVHGFFEQDLRDHSYDQILTGRIPPGYYIFLKFLAHWILAAGPLVLIGPFVAWIFDAGTPQLMLLSLLAATMLFILIAMLGSALTARTNQSGLLLALVVLPLYIPVLIFAALAAQSGAGIEGSEAALLFLYAGLAAALPAIPVICAAMIEMQMR